MSFRGKTQHSIILTIIVIGVATIIVLFDVGKKSGTPATDRGIVRDAKQFVYSPDVVANTSFLLQNNDAWTLFKPSASRETDLNDIFPSIPAGSQIIDVAVDWTTHAVSYVTRLNGVDTVFLITPNHTLPIMLTEARHLYSDVEDVKNTWIIAHMQFSPTGKYLVIQRSLWEGCETLVFDVATGQQLTVSGCDTYIWSQDGSRAVRITVGYGDTENVAISYSGEPDHFIDVTWDKIHGDTSKLFNGTIKQLVGSIIAADFRTPDHLVLLSGAGSDELWWLGELSLANKTYRKIASFTSQGLERLNVIGNTALVYNSKQVRTVDLLEGNINEIQQTLFSTSGNVDVSIIGTASKKLYVMQRNFDQQWQLVRQYIIVIDPEGRRYSIVDSIDLPERALIAGIQPSQGMSSRILRDMDASELSAAELAVLDAQIEDWNLYRSDTVVVLGGLDCGQSENHDRLVALNQSDKSTMFLNDGLLITNTPNLYDWDTAALQAFVSDPTVVCGVATTLPRAVVGERILWWDTCVGGAGPPGKDSPDYTRVIKCLQAEDVVNRHFGITGQ